jgi:lysophospholipase L1-like esterase
MRTFNKFMFIALWLGCCTYSQAAAKVLCIGDSITAGEYGITAYPTRLARNTGYAVINAGIGGERAAKGLARIDALLTQYHPSHVLILFGANDIWKPYQDLRSSAYAVLQMALRTRASGAIPVVGTAMPFFGPNIGFMPRVNEFNGYVRAYASEYGFLLADLQSAYGSGYGLLLSDGVHPNNAGAELIARTFTAKLRESDFWLNPRSMQISDTGASGRSFAVIAGKPWTTMVLPPWITIVSTGSGTGNGTIYFDVEPNPGLARSGTITVSSGGINRNFTVNQEAATLAINPSIVCLPNTGTAGREIAITAHLPWTAIANQPWISITSGQSGTSNGLVTFSVATNAGNIRSGTLTVSVGGISKSVSVHQWPAATHPLVSAEGDFDGDFMADFAVFHPATGNWRLSFSSGGNWTVPFGWSATIPVPADYDGDGLLDFAVYHPKTGNWYILQSATGQALVENFGWSSTVPIPGDYDGDGLADLAVFHQATARWYFKCSTAGSSSAQFGWSKVIPVPADYDGDGTTDIAVYHPATGNWYIYESSNQFVRQVQLGGSKARPVPADFDSDGAADVAVFTRTTGNWQILYSGGGGLELSYGWSAVTPVPADYDGDGAADIAVYHPATGNWYVRQSTTEQTVLHSLGSSTEKPTLLYPMIHSWFRLP